MPSLIELFEQSEVSREEQADLTDMSFIYLTLNQDEMRRYGLEVGTVQVPVVDPELDRHEAMLPDGRILRFGNDQDVYELR